MRYLVEKNKPFQGYVQSVVLPDGTVGYTNGLTIEQYSAERGCEYDVINDEQLDKLIAEYEQTYIDDKAHEVSEEAWHDALNCLPPVRWHRHADVELFAISECTWGNVTAWYARIGNRFCTFQDLINGDSARLAKRAKDALS